MSSSEMKLKMFSFPALSPRFLTPSNNGLLSYESRPAGRIAGLSFALLKELRKDLSGSFEVAI